MSYLVETSVFTRFANPSVQSALIARADDLFRCAVADIEVGFSASNAAEWDQRKELVESCEPLDIQPADWASALAIQRSLAARALKGRKPMDLIAAAVAIRTEMTVLHYDGDFELIAGVTGLRHEWVVPRGTID